MTDTKLSLPLILAALRKLWWVVITAAALGAIGAFGYSSLQPPLFHSSATLFFALNQGTSAVDLNQGSVYTQSQMLSFAQLARSSRVLEPVIEELGLATTSRALARSIEIAIPQSTVTLRVTAITASPDRSADLSNAVARELIAAVRDVAPKGPDGASTITASVIDAAVPAQVQTSPNKTQDALLGGVLGGTIGIALVLVLRLFDTRLRSEETLDQAGGPPVLGIVSESATLSSPGVAVIREPLGLAAEQFRHIRSALAYADVTSPTRVLLVTSGSPGEGKSTVSINLAATIAALQQSVLLIDADMRKPRAHEYVGIDGSVGLTNVLLGEVEFDVAKKRVANTTLEVLPAGDIPPNPAELLTSPPMSNLVEEVARKYDYVVFDSPPTLPVADSSLLSPLIDGVVFVVSARSTRRAALGKSLRTLETSGARVLGTVLNRARRDRRQRRYYREDA